MTADVTVLARVMDPARPRMEQIAEFRQAVLQCYCELGPACPLWRRMTPQQRMDCSADKRLVAQRLWKNGV